MTELEIAAYLDRGMTAPDRARIEDHLVACVTCRERLSDSQETLAVVQRPSRWNHVLLTSAIAAVLLISIIPTLMDSRQDRQTRDLDESPSLVARYPAGNLDLPPKRFVWSRVTGAMSYRITVSTPDGTTLWTSTVSDTIATPPRSVVSNSGTYLWAVDATMSDESVLSSALTEFRFKGDQR